MHSTRLASCFCFLVSFLATSSSPASAQPTGLELRAELGGAMMLSNYQRDDLGLDGISPAVAGRVGWRMTDWLALQLGAEYAYFPSDLEAASQVAFVAGLRLQPRLGSTGRLFIDANGGTARTGDVFRPAGSVGLGFEFAVGSAVGLGPFVRYVRTFTAANDVPSDAQFVVAGVSVALRSEPGPVETEEELEPVDSDGDGVPDAEDPCPDEVPGTRPDASRPGCPIQDSDADGVPDTEDECPTTRQGSDPDPERAGCPAGDRDGDGISDSRDQCPEEPQGEMPDPERAGCPAPDRDDDTVPDAEDACPDEAGAPSTDPERNGCPALARVQSDRIEALEPIFFAHDSDRILPRSRPTLESIAEVLRARPQLRISIEGHTDQVGDAEYNLELSQRRAQAVLERLAESGIDRSRLDARGFGQTRPAAEGTDARARAQNRRVEFRIVR